MFRTDEVDLVVLNEAPLRFGHRILKTGKLLLLRNKEELIGFSEKVVKLYLDFRFFRDSFDSAFPQPTLHEAGSNEYITPAPTGMNPPDKELTCIDSETDARGSGAFGYSAWLFDFPRLES